MQDLEILTHENFEWITMKYYDNPHCMSIEEYRDDMMRLKYIKKLITRYEESRELKHRLILNHIIILNNVFGPKLLCKILWLKMPEKLPIIKPFLILLNILPDKIYNVGEINVIDTTEIPMNQDVIDALRKI